MPDKGTMRSRKLVTQLIEQGEPLGQGRPVDDPIDDPIGDPGIEEEEDGAALFDRWCDVNKVYRWEGERGVHNLENLVTTLGYHDVDEFLADNPGAIEHIVNFVQDWLDRTKDYGPEDWYSRMKDAIGDLTEEEPELED